MGRIRTIKPELIATERFAMLSDAAVRLFLGCYSLVDDEGNCPAGATYLNGQIFYGRPRHKTAIGRLLSEIEAARLVDLYMVDGAQYLGIIGWFEKEAPTHQRIEKPQGARFPRPSSKRSWNAFRDGVDPIRREESGADSDHSLSLVSNDTSPDPDGFKPPVGGKAEREAERRIAAGEIDEIDRDLCWDYCEETGRTGDAAMLRAIASQRPRAKTKAKPKKPSKEDATTNPLALLGEGVKVPRGQWGLLDGNKLHQFLGREHQDTIPRSHPDFAELTTGDEYAETAIDGRPVFVYLGPDGTSFPNGRTLLEAMRDRV
jgi:hypothetical protein